ncbi:hypothetical protein [Psychroserpens sp.]|uniref:hypothetical protein n=1 Tax=Psychroserpens sp. TaxID=2020870 RepID=UPI001AFE7E4D|nr:hypothetical protein [Psychroserpens sp.]MBO6605623.1 hypothetical protein [Psychroserpens sp.]MBO6631174.1 hypothetical protein [Psychroserpens sp.]MBO6653568.1 hypothetical protein [Psychroserpens sp.]MBO6681889.1 hypothetical protein [Psychroserpens sp.]MBO6748997.1 hypothetical protein [Psychroserpens sp.]
MKKYKIVVVLLCFFFSINNYCQNKNEKESKISKTDFPSSALQTLSLVPENAKRIKYYQETDGEKLSYECKFKFQNLWHSVEFNEDGKLEDIEVKVRKHQLSQTVRERINNYLSQNSDKFDIVKIQEQYVQDKSSSDLTFFKSTISNREHTASNYELIVAIKHKKDWTLKEMTFDKQGNFTNTRDLQTDSYEYIMY